MSRGHTVIPVSRRKDAGLFEVRSYEESPVSDVVIHLAEEPDQRKANQLGEAYIHQTARVVTALARHRNQRVIYASSGVVYGGEHESPCPVETPVVGTDVYSRSKLKNEQIVLAAGGVAVRFSNLFGVGMAGTNVLSDILRQIPGIGPIRVRDDRPIRDFLAVSDAASALGLLVERAYSGVLNVGSGIGTSIRGLSAVLLTAANQPARDVISTRPSVKRSVNVLDISATVCLLRWSPAASLEEHLRHLVAAKE